MFEIKQYIIAVTAAAVVGSIAISICDKKGALSAVVKMVVGVIMTVTVLKPLIQIEITDLSNYLSTMQFSASDAVQSGKEWANSETAAIIKDQTEAYILDKASSLGLHVGVEVGVSEQPPSAPFSAVITGKVSPYAKTQLSDILEKDIGVLKENQRWIQ